MRKWILKRARARRRHTCKYVAGRVDGANIIADFRTPRNTWFTGLKSAAPCAYPDTTASTPSLRPLVALVIYFAVNYLIAHSSRINAPSLRVLHAIPARLNPRVLLTSVILPVIPRLPYPCFPVAFTVSAKLRVPSIKNVRMGRRADWRTRRIDAELLFLAIHVDTHGRADVPTHRSHRSSVSDYRPAFCRGDGAPLWVAEERRRRMVLRRSGWRRVFLGN